MKGLSLRYKLLAALTVIPLVGLSLFLMLAVNIFEKDKIAYVFDSSLSVSKGRAARVSSDISNMVSLTQGIVLSYRSDTKNLAEAGTYYFEREAKFAAFQLHALNPSTAGYDVAVDLKKPGGSLAIEGASVLIPKMISEARDRGLVVRGSPIDPGKLFVAARFGQVNDPRHVIAIALFEAADLARLFTERSSYVGFLARKSDSSPIFITPGLESQWDPGSVWAELARRRTPEGIAELVSPNNVRYLASFADAGVGDLVVVALVERRAALSAVTVLLRKSVLFFTAVISLTTIIAVLASRGLTRALRRLSLATRKVASGDFEVRVPEKSGGEIGLLASSFNAMAGEVSRLMKETAEKARMENELATARTVQETLFPDGTAQLGPVGISGCYMPASECGGDWWYYFENDERVYIWIGDATGHGAPAALLTSAARAVASVINFGPAPTVSDALRILNRAICETSKGRMMMTFFLARIDKRTGEMTYANASHEPPLLLRSQRGASEPPKRDDFIPLNNVNNPRLGEQIDRDFLEAKLQLLPGDRVVFYTDGLVDAKNPEQKSWGERRFLKALSAELTVDGPPKGSVEGIVKQLQTYRSEFPLDDDVTLVLCTYGEAGRGAA